MVPGSPAAGGPGLLRELPGGALLPDDGLHHLADEAVRQKDHGVAVLVGDVKGLLGQIHRLLDVGGGQDHGAVIAVSTAPGGLEIVPLGGLDGPQARAAPHDVHHHGGQLAGGQIADALLLQADAGGGGGGHDGFSGCGAAVDHIYGSYFTFCLKHYHTGGFPGHLGLEGLKHLALGSNRVTEIAVTAVTYGGMGDSLVTLHQFYVIFHLL